MARDKELSTFKSQTLRIGATYEFARSGWRFVKKGTLNIFYDRMRVRLRGLPRRALLVAALVRPGVQVGRQRAVLLLRRQRLPGVRLRLVLTCGTAQ